MRIVLIGRGKMGTLIRETAAAAGDGEAFIGPVLSASWADWGV